MEIITLYNLSHQSSITRNTEVHKKIMVKHLALFSLRTESDNPDATCELSP